MITADVLDLIPDVKTALHGLRDSLSAILLLSQEGYENLKRGGGCGGALKDIEVAAQRAFERLSAIRKFIEALETGEDARRAFVGLVTD